jgi:Condensation domain
MSAGDPSIDLSRLSAAEKRQLLARLLAEKAEFQPLSYAQWGMWFVNQLAPNSSAYNTGFAMRILSAANPTMIDELFQTIVHRHPTLRTTFALRGGQLFQKTHPTTHFSLERIDSPGANEATLRERIHHSLARPFDLKHGPLIRVTLFTRGATDHVLLIAIHHIAFDGWSFWVLLDEFQRLCEAESLPPLETSYADFVNWERKMLAGPSGAQHRAYWEKQLAGKLPVLDLLADRPRPPHQAYAGRALPFALDQDVARQVRDRAAASGTTPFTYLLAVYMVFLCRHSGQEDVIVGSPTTGRSRPEFGGVIGDFVNMIALRARLHDNLPFRDFLQEVRQVVLEALEHQEYPFPLLVERVGSSRGASHTPIFQASFVFQKAQTADRLSGLVSCADVATRFDCGELRLAPYPITQQAGQFDLTLEIAETGEQMNGAFKYDTALFEDTTAVRMVARFLQLLSASIANPDCRISDLPMLTECERTRTLSAGPNIEISELPVEPSLSESGIDEFVF